MNIHNVYNTLTEALCLVNARQIKSIPLILSMDGSMYFVYSSEPVDHIHGRTSYHAEELMIKDIDHALHIFYTRRKRSPKKIEVYISHSPCIANDRNPSPAMLSNGVFYGRSCRSKIYVLIKKYKDIRWRFFYAMRYGALEAPANVIEICRDSNLKQNFLGISIQPMPIDISKLFMQRNVM